jgi:hypothetical protein
LGDGLRNERERSEAAPNQPSLYWARHSVLLTAEHGTYMAAPDLSVVLGNLGLLSSERIMPCALWYRKQRRPQGRLFRSKATQESVGFR